jgi:hypothetical protein
LLGVRQHESGSALLPKRIISGVPFLFPLIRQANNKGIGLKSRVEVGMKIILAGEVVVGGRDSHIYNPQRSTGNTKSLEVSVVIS